MLKKTYFYFYFAQKILDETIILPLLSFYRVELLDEASYFLIPEFDVFGLTVS